MLTCIRLSLFPAAASNLQTCALDQMANNVNPDWLTNCTRNPNCTQLTCRAEGVLENFFSSITFTDMSCLTLPGVRMVFMLANGRVATDTLVTESQVVTSTHPGIGGIFMIVVLAQSTVSHSVNITVRSSHHNNYYCLMPLYDNHNNIHADWSSDCQHFTFWFYSKRLSCKLHFTKSWPV